MSEPMLGGCQCGHIRYSIGQPPIDLVVCHCKECQRQSGSAFGMSLAIRSTAFKLIAGGLKQFTVLCDSGRTKTCAFCPNCGTRIYHQTSPAGMSIKAGTLDDTSHLAPATHYWTKRKQTWVVIPSGATCVEDDG